MSYSTRRIESVAPSIKRCDANLPTMILRQQTRARRALLDWLRRLAGSAHSAIAGILQTDICPCRNSSVVAIFARRPTSEISPSHSPTSSGGSRATRKLYRRVQVTDKRPNRASGVGRGRAEAAKCTSEMCETPVRPWGRHLLGSRGRGKTVN